jgi:hypothetical protein
MFIFRPDGGAARFLITALFLLFVLTSTAEARRRLTASATPKPASTPSPQPTSTPTPVAAPCITITAPLADAKVAGSVPISTVDTCSGLWFERLYVDSAWVADFPPGQVVFNSASYSNGDHQIEVAAQSENPGSVMLGNSTEQLNVQNVVSTATPSPVPTTPPTPSPSLSPSPTVAPTASRTPVPTNTPAPTPKPTPSPSCITITAPPANSIVSGASVAISTSDTCTGLWFESLYVDGSHIADFSPGKVVLNSTSFANGSHNIEVTSQSENPGSVVLGSAAEPLNIENTSATATVSPTPGVLPTGTPNPGPTSTPTSTAHLSNLSPGAALPSESTCATLANQSNFPETTSANVNDGTGWDSNNQIWTTPSYFYANAGRNGLAPSSDFAAVDGNYAGTTQDIIRWAACKWGVDEDWAYAESSQEHSWVESCAQLHGGTTCSGGGDCNNPDSDSGGETANLSFMGFPVTNSSAAFVGTNGYGDSGCSGNWASWGILQSKVQSFEWYTWPMIALSTAWNEDYRWAKYRACVNGDYANWFGNNSDYLNAVSRAKSNPNGPVPSGQTGPTNLFANETNLQYLGLGCIGTHYSGQWYDSGAVSYLTSSGWGFLYILNNSAWPGGLR